ncbi:hypothetical protein AAGF08_20285 [Algoriphagus sp. SE2]|uniref:hypothetical protein n=1 Tax=Algoriphagus sp. SE2 TaxID=3141536 RepID=UPI0031CD8C46
MYLSKLRCDLRYFISFECIVVKNEISCLRQASSLVEMTPIGTEILILDGAAFKLNGRI